MADETPRAGRLIAVDGSRGIDVLAEANAIAERLRARGMVCGISRWDASGLFSDLLLAEERDLVVTPHMLSLLYATDLVFRLRWEIQPALAEGHVVIAAPYVHSAIAVGIGLGLTENWVREVLRFAPAADALRLAKERKRQRGWRPNPARGFGEYCAAVLANTAAALKPRRGRAMAIDWLAGIADPSRAARRKDIVGRASGVAPGGKVK